MKSKNLIFFLLLANFVYFSSSQAVTAYYANPDLEWQFIPTQQGAFGGYQFQTELRTGGPRLFFGKYLGSAATFISPKRLWNGNMFQGEEINVAEPNNNLNLGTTFGISMWIYIGEITGTHALMCKQLPNATNPGYSLCLLFDANKFFWRVGNQDPQPPNATVQAELKVNDPSYNVTLTEYEDIYHTGMIPCIGWQYLHFNVMLIQDRVAAVGYMFCDNHFSFNFTTVAKSMFWWQDDNLNYMTVGAMLATTTTVQYPFIGIINHIQIWKQPIGKFQVFDQYTYKCQPYCKLCKVVEVPMCIQQNERSILAWWDFAPPHWTFRNYLIPDLGRFARALNPLTIDTQWNEPTSTGNEPVYVDRQGFYFDTATKFLTRPGFNFNNHPSLGAAQGNINSFTCEAWIRPLLTGAVVNNMFIVRKIGGAGPNYFALSLQAGPIAQVSFNAIPMQQAIVMTNGSWYYFAGSILKINNFQSKFCLQFYNYYKCQTYNQIFTDTGRGAEVRIGGGFLGIIRKVKFFEYPKVDLEIRHNMRLASNDACVAFNGGMCLQCDVDHRSNDTDFRYGCYSDCNFNEYDIDCRTCHAECRTCHGQDEYNCLSCLDNDFDLHWPGHRCIEECGDGQQMGYYECDDGNLNNGDGCTNYCKIEPGWYCSGGTNTTADVCAEVCGDSRRVLQACDDGNTASGDGCSATCLVEAGYTCLGGGLTARDICFETCGDGLNRGNYQCDDGNTINNDGCSQACKIELGWTCFGGTFTTPDGCTETCGDGMARGSLACDDGNLVSGDGCSSTCTIEFGWACYTVSSLLPSICYKISSPKLIDYYIEENSVLYLKFNETVRIGSTWAVADWKLEIDGPIPPYIFEWELYQENGLKTTPANPLIINLTIPSQLYGLEQLYFTIEQKSTLLSGTYSTQTEETGFVLDLMPQDATDGDGIIFNSKNVDCGTGSNKAIIFPMLYLNFGLAIMQAMFLQSTAVLFHLIGCVQICKISLLTFPVSLSVMYQAVYPTCLVDFFKTISQVGIKFTLVGGSLMSGFVDSDSFTSEAPDYKYERIGYTSGSILKQSGDLIILWAVLFILYCVFYAIEFVLQAIPYIRNICQRYRYNFFIAGMNFTFVKMSFDVCFSLLFVNASNDDQKISTGVTVGMAVFVMCYPAWLAHQGGMYHQELNAVEKDELVQNTRSTHIFVEYDSSHPTCYFYLLFQCIKKALFVLIAISMYKQYCYALALSVFLQFASLMYLTYVRPFKANLNNVMIIFEEFMTLVCFLVLLRYANKDSVESYDTSRQFAYMFSFYVLILVIIPPILAFMEFVRMLRYMRDICNWKRDLQDQKDSFESSQPSENEESVDLLKNQQQEDSLVEKEITISSSSEEYVPKKRRNKDDSPRSFDNSRTIIQPAAPAKKEDVKEEESEDDSQDEKIRAYREEQAKREAAKQAELDKRAMQRADDPAPKKETPQQKPPSKQKDFQALDFQQAIDDAAKAKERLPQLKNTPQQQ